jgi:putative NADH-flavin reductase
LPGAAVASSFLSWYYSTVRIAVLGASGRLGRRLVGKALEAGHRVVAFVRFPIFLHRFSHNALTVIRGDPKDERAVERVISGADAVMAVLGPDAGIAPDSTKRAASAVISAMKRVGVRRLVWQTGSGVPYMGETLFGSRKAMRSALQLIGSPALKKVEEGLRLIMESDLDCTVVRFNRIELMPSLRKLQAPFKSARPKVVSPDEAAGIMLAQLADVDAWRRSPSSN